MSRWGVGPLDSVHLIIKTPAGKELFRGVERLKSGLEIYGEKVAKHIKPGDSILVEASTAPSTGAGANGWSPSEVAATVSDYFSMFSAELKGETYSKTDHRNALMEQLENRSKQAVEYKHANISAVLRDMGLPYIAGYKPRGNYQELLGDAVAEYLDALADLRKAIEQLDGTPVDAPPNGAQFTLAEIEVPAPQSWEQTAKGKRVAGTYARAILDDQESAAAAALLLFFSRVEGYLRAAHPKVITSLGLDVGEIYRRTNLGDRSKHLGLGDLLIIYGTAFQIADPALVKEKWPMELTHLRNNVAHGQMSLASWREQLDVLIRDLPKARAFVDAVAERSGLAIDLSN